MATAPGAAGAEECVQRGRSQSDPSILTEARIGYNNNSAATAVTLLVCLTRNELQMCTTAAGRSVQWALESAAFVALHHCNL
ncbi:hypothetical protein SRHO_G00275090 [Serrasalmus rhombeus]